jgi:hypothetical protein
MFISRNVNAWTAGNDPYGVGALSSSWERNQRTCVNHRREFRFVITAMTIGRIVAPDRLLFITGPRAAGSAGVATVHSQPR